jgi:threonine aldolase
MHEIVDLRSDTFTLPTPAMRQAMAEAEVGDDVWEEDPTVKRLEAMAAERLGKEAGLFVVSGTMGNLVGVLSHTEPGQEIILDSEAHMFHFEVAGAARIGGLQTRPLETARGFPTPGQVRAAIRPRNIHVPATGLVCLENTHNRHGGTVCTPEEVAEIAEVAHAHGVPVHLDGARIFNAAVALKREVREFARETDSVQFCLSKGLGAPAGSLLVGSREYIARARRWRKRLGGGLRQVGVLAAPGIVALTQMVERLAEDHDNARLLAEGLVQLPGIRLDLDRVQSNIVIFHVDPPGGAETLVRAALARRVKIHQIGPTSIRLVTHKDVDRDDIQRALDVFRELTRGWPPSSK